VEIGSAETDSVAGLFSPVVKVSGGNKGPVTSAGYSYKWVGSTDGSGGSFIGKLQCGATVSGENTCYQKAHSFINFTNLTYLPLCIGDTFPRPVTIQGPLYTSTQPVVRRSWPTQSNMANQATCHRCPGGYLSLSMPLSMNYNTTKCIKCASGLWSFAGAAICDACVPGSSIKTQTNCVCKNSIIKDLINLLHLTPNFIQLFSFFAAFFLEIMQPRLLYNKRKWLCSVQFRQIFTGKGFICLQSKLFFGISII